MLINNAFSSTVMDQAEEVHNVLVVMHVYCKYCIKKVDLDTPTSKFLYPLNPSVGSRGGWSLSQQSSGERRGTPWTGRTETNNHIHSHSLLRTI